MRENWEEVELDEITVFALGGDWGKAEDFKNENFDAAYCIRGAEFKNWDVDFGKTASVRMLKKNSIEKRNLVLGDILVEISGGGPEQPVGRTEVISQTVLNNFKGSKLVCTNFLRLIRLSKFTNSEFINWYLKYFYSTGKIRDYQAGSNNLRNLKFNKYLTLGVPIAPLPEQRAIVAKIEELFSDLDKGITDLKKAQDQLKVYRQAVLKKAFEGELTKEWREQQTDLPNDWIKKTIREVCENVKVGIVIKPTQYYTDDVENGIPAFRSANVREFRVNDSNWVYFSEEGNNANKRTQLNTGDVLIVRSGYPGTSCVVPEKFKGSNAIDILIATPIHDLITSEFLCTFNNSPFAKGLFSEGSRGVAQKHLNVGVYSKLNISIPSITEQKLILKEIESRLSICDKVEESISESLEKAKALRQSILKKAFEGTLLSEEELAACKAAPDYEPASVLLERIKAEKELV